MYYPLNTVPCAVDSPWSNGVVRREPRPVRGATRYLTAPLFHVDAFAEQPFEGNQAAVVLLNEHGRDAWMRCMAAELNQSETAFVVATTRGFDLRWYTPTAEVSLCGHATLASAHVLWETGRVAEQQQIRFRTRSGALVARRTGCTIELDLPARPATATHVPSEILQALAVSPRYSARTTEDRSSDRDYLLELESESAVRDVRPDFTLLRDSPGGVMVTAATESGPQDFVSRYFAPWWGIDEDPVTGAAHCALMPYWAQRFGKSELVGRQLSERGGVVHARLEGDRVFLAGSAVTVSQGMLVV